MYHAISAARRKTIFKIALYEEASASSRDAYFNLLYSKSEVLFVVVLLLLLFHLFIHVRRYSAMNELFVSPAVKERKTT